MEAIGNKCIIRTEAPIFGLKDAEGMPADSFIAPATSDTDVIISNPENTAVAVLFIDKCLIDQGSSKRCDFGLAYKETGILIEVKNAGYGWQQKAAEQLTSTIQNYKEAIVPILEKQFKYAVIANNKVRPSRVNFNQLIERFNAANEGWSLRVQTHLHLDNL